MLDYRSVLSNMVVVTNFLYKAKETLHFVGNRTELGMNQHDIRISKHDYPVSSLNPYELSLWSF